MKNSIKIKKEINNINVDNQLAIVDKLAGVVSLKDYKKKVDGLRFLLVENWCLCKYCQLYDKQSQNFNHWLSDLSVCINNLRSSDIKNGIDKRCVLSKMLIQDYDYTDASMISRIIRDKFEAENIVNIQQVLQVTSKDFADDITNLIDIIKDKTLSIEDYLIDTFQINMEL